MSHDSKPWALTIHPEHFSGIDIPGGEAVQRIAGEIRHAVERLADAYVAIKRDPTLTDAKKAHEMEKMRTRHASHAMPKIDSLFKIARHAAEKAENELSESFSHAATFFGARSVVSPSEIREHVRQLPAGERMTFIHQAVTRGDTQTAAAVLLAPRYLSGLESVTDEGWAAELAHARATVAPEAHALAESAKKLEDRIHQLAYVWRKHFGRPVNGAADIQRLVDARLNATA